MKLLPTNKTSWIELITQIFGFLIEEERVSLFPILCVYSLKKIDPRNQMTDQWYLDHAAVKHFWRRAVEGKFIEYPLHAT